jgi:hypothetical protein
MRVLIHKCFVTNVTECVTEKTYIAKTYLVLLCSQVYLCHVRRKVGEDFSLSAFDWDQYHTAESEVTFSGTFPLVRPGFVCAVILQICTLFKHKSFCHEEKNGKKWRVQAGRFFTAFQRKIHHHHHLLLLLENNLSQYTASFPIITHVYFA